MDRSVISKTTAYTFSSTFVGKNQLYITAAVTDKDADQLSVCREIYFRIAKMLKQDKLHIVQERIFCSMNMHADLAAVRRNVMCAAGTYEEFPITFIQGRPLWGDGFAGVQIFAVTASGPGDEVWTIYEKAAPCGRGWKRNGTTYLMLQNLHGLHKESNEANCRETQTARMFDYANRLLLEQGADYHNVVRTWIYLSDILDWYGAFNEVRNAKYAEFGLMPEITNGITAEQICLPASTGIEGKNSLGAASVMDVLAVKKGVDSQIEIIQNTGCKQRSPYRYGSAFSRSMILREPESDLFYISGTASIDEEGRTLFPGDPREQIKKTLSVVDALIKHEGASLSDICQATVFLRNAEDAWLYRDAIESYGLTGIPAICVVADICRDDLMFEMDAIAVVENV